MFLSMKLSDVRLLWVFSLFLLPLFGCVKEKRGECPCRLVVGLDEVDSSHISDVFVSVTGTGDFGYGEVREAETYQDDKVVLVPRGEVFLNVYHEDQGMRDSAGICIPLGEECPSVYMYSAYMDTDCEYVRKQVLLSKNHCVITVYVEGADESFPFGMSLRGNVCGYDLYGDPRSGDFMCSMEACGDMQYTGVVPRQRDPSLMLEVKDGEEVIRAFAVGEYIRSSGYDWTETDLKDIMIGIDYSRTLITVSVRGWDEVYEFDVVI